ncbi:methionine synthase (B12-dependent) [Propionicimonas paludicola]|uniref:Methionine synthase n=1 Tax=Propionicimonas paludicola TaxID=185243 RepID=A0A2A9CQJ3_9ACTN|nr:methionine synthase [Propionicimonas paludicola]PFG16704.1 methionine synthase (B12-dependent) [Propionicimonas paludicola]
MTRNLRMALADRVLVADGGMGTMLQGRDLTLADFQGLEGCNEILNVTRPDVVADIHRAYFAAGADCVETNTFGANLSALGEYDAADRIVELAEAGARIARAEADAASTPDRPRFVLGSIGPGTKLPSLLHVSYAQLRDAYQAQAEAMITGGVDAFQVETCQDLLQTKAAINGARRAQQRLGADLPIFANVTIETSGTMLLGSEIGAALTSLGALGIEAIGLNCGTGPTEMSEHLRHLARHTDLPLVCMPNAGLPELTADGARYPMGPTEFVDYVSSYAKEFQLGLVGGCCGTTPAHISALAAAVAGRQPEPRAVPAQSAVSSLYVDVPLHQDTAYLSIGERTNANGSKAFREAMLVENWDDCVDIAKQQSREGAHLLDLCVDYVGRDGVADMSELASRLATAVSLPVMLDSTEPAVIKAGLERLAGRCVVNSVNFEDGDGPDSRYAKVMPLVVEHGAAVVALTIDEEGQARTAEWKLRVADRLIADLTGRWGLAVGDIIVDCLTFPIATGQEETRRDALETIEAIAAVTAKYPGIHTTLGVSNVSFGLNPAARQVLNSVFLHECQQAGLDSGIVPTARILPIARIPEEQRQVAEDLIYDRRTPDYDPLSRFLELFDGATTASTKEARAAEMAALPVDQRLRRRIIDGDAKGLTDDLDLALASKPGLAIINDDLLAGMKEVGELFGAGKMQLPFVLASAEVMKAAVRYLEPHLDKADAAGKGTLVIATVKGDVHDIGKNLVDIILTNNGYTVVNLGIKQPVSAIAEAALAHNADGIGMSGLLVKSTLVMRDNLEELNRRGLAQVPVLLGGAALTRAFVEQDLNQIYEGEVRYAKDAFEGLALMERVVAVRRGEPGASLPEPRQRRVKPVASAPAAAEPAVAQRSDVARGIDVPTPPFWGSRVVKGLSLAEVSGWLDHRATFVGQWGLKPVSGGPSYEELVEAEAMPRLRRWLDRIHTEGLVEPALVYGYWPCHSEGDDLIVGHPEDPSRELLRFSWPRQSRDRHLCLADFFRDAQEAAELGPDVIALQLVTMGEAASQATAKLFAADAYRDYLELHGLTVQLAEALAEYWHARVRSELGLSGDGDLGQMLTKQAYRGSRYSFGYPACPDLTDRAKLVSLLEPERISVSLSEEWQLHPEQSTDAIIVHHPEAKYFNAG